eukprot:gene6876-492_t
MYLIRRGECDVVVEQMVRGGLDGSHSQLSVSGCDGSMSGVGGCEERNAVASPRCPPPRLLLPPGEYPAQGVPGAGARGALA